MRRCDHNLLWLGFAALQALLIGITTEPLWVAFHFFGLASCAFTFFLGSWKVLGVFYTDGWHIRFFVYVHRKDEIPVTL